MDKARIYTKAHAHFKNVHPTKSAGRKFVGKDAPVITGVSERTANEGRFVKCKQCGFVVDRTINPKGSGYGNETVSAVTNNDGDTALNVKDPTVTAGCPLCGASSYE